MENVDNLIIETAVVTVIDFYKNVFNWKVVTKPTVPEPYWMIKKNIPGDIPIDAVIFERIFPDRGAINTFITKDIATLTTKIIANGGSICPAMPNAIGLPNNWIIRFFNDPQGALFSVMQMI